MNNKEEFKAGDIVYLKSGSPAMLVIDIINHEIKVIYFSPIDYLFKTEWFNFICLTNNKPTF